MVGEHLAAHDLDARRDEHVVDLVARLRAGQVLPAPRAANPAGVMASIVHPHMFMSPDQRRRAVGRREPAPEGARLERGAELEVGEVGGDDREVGAVDVDLRVQEHARPTGRRQLREGDGAGRRIGLRESTASTSRRRPGRRGAGRPSSLGFGLHRDRAMGMATPCIPSRVGDPSCWACRRRAPTPPGAR